MQKSNRQLSQQILLLQGIYFLLGSEMPCWEDEFSCALSDLRLNIKVPRHTTALTLALARQLPRLPLIDNFVGLGAEPGRDTGRWRRRRRCLTLGLGVSCYGL